MLLQALYYEDYLNIAYAKEKKKSFHFQRAF